MSKRVTVMIDDELDEKLRIVQAAKIKQTGASYSFSRALNEVLRRGFNPRILEESS